MVMSLNELSRNYRNRGDKILKDSRQAERIKGIPDKVITCPEASGIPANICTHHNSFPCSWQETQLKLASATKKCLGSHDQWA